MSVNASAQAKTNRQAAIAAVMITVCILGTAFAVVQSKHQSRMLYKKTRMLQHSIDQASIDWGRLQIEESTLARYGRIEEVANSQLKMISPEHSDIRTVVIK